MTNDTSNNTKLTQASQQTADPLTKRRSIGIPKLHQRLTQQAATQPDVSSMQHRIGLMLDVSGSMHTDGKMSALIDAMTSFLDSCDLTTTALAIETFGDDEPHKLPLTTFHPLLMTTIMSLRAVGGTPMSPAMYFVLRTYPVTRCVLVSDGQPDNPSACIEAADQYADATIAVDCVHIGDSTRGEALMQQIAERTGGLFIKFRDIKSFASSFKYLTPALRQFLTDGSDAAKLLGATEVK